MSIQYKNNMSKILCEKYTELLNVIRHLKYKGIPYKFRYVNFVNGGLGVVIDNRCEIGKNVTIYQNTTLGVRHGGFPVIEDGVTIFANAVVIGNVRIGYGSKIGAGAVVLNNVPAGSTVVGNPAKVI